MSNNDVQVETSRAATFFSKNGWWTAAALFMTLVGIALLVIFLLPNHNTTGATTPPTPTGNPTAPLSSSPTASTTTPALTGWADLGCNGTKGSRSVPNLPPRATWDPVGSFTAPSSPQYGPTRTQQGVRACYQHTPTGALFAAINFPFEIGSASPADYSSVVQALMTPGAQRDQLVAEGQTTNGSGAAFTVAAYRIDACTADRCNLRLIMSSAGKLLEVPSSMVWSGGDWKADGANMAGTPGPVAAMPAGFTNFGPGA
ncbi:hypothetical protein GCM10028801_44630 [Nocardioides maradonensis]